MAQGRFKICLLAGMLAFGLTSPAAFAEEVDLELVLAVDASGSVDQNEFALQMGGIAAAFHDPAVRGFALGTASHGIGTARAFQESEQAGAFAALAMGLNGLLTAVLLPWLLPPLMRWMA